MPKINGFELCTKILEVARNMPFEVSIAIDDIINLAANIYYICSTMLNYITDPISLLPVLIMGFLLLL
jgi:hypothetical protein